jgi:hypothetical protein
MTISKIVFGDYCTVSENSFQIPYYPDNYFFEVRKMVTYDYFEDGFR